MGRHLTTITHRAAASAAALSLAAPAAAEPTSLTVREHAVFAAINRVRAEHGRPALRLDVRLVRAARDHTSAIAASGVFAHGRYWRYIEREGVTTGTVGETLGWAAPPTGAERRIVAMWLASPEHRAVLLGPYRTVGIGERETRFMGYGDAVVVTADFHAP